MEGKGRQETKIPGNPVGERMKERPIIFSADSIRAILDGRKTQTRRVVSAVDETDALCKTTAGEIFKGEFVH